jgi:DNA-binding response OmpR family regulator
MNSIIAPSRLGRSVGRGRLNLTTRSAAAGGNNFAKVNVVVDWARGEICHRGGRRCKLSIRETALLACLARKAGVPVSRDEILAQVWQLDPRHTTTRTIDMHISNLRRKLEDDAKGPRVLLTVHGVGYMFHRGPISSDDVHPSAGEGGSAPSEVTTGIESLSTLG